MTIEPKSLLIWIWYSERKRMVNDMIQKFTISWFHREAGLFFFTMGMIAILVLAGGVFSGEGILTVYAGEQTSAITAAENAETEDGDADMSDTAAEEDENIVVVIDPGHGGENLGAEYEEYTEKEMTLIVAKAMKAELEQYEGITVYLTRTGDEDLTLEERCDYAASVNADFLFCLHFNMSEYHTLFGAETWISAFGEQYSKGYAFADIEIGLLQEMGLYSRGIKTRLNDEGEDYYGIIRHSTEQNIPCVLIEHCHLSVPIPSQTMKPDSTEPDVCMIELVNQNMENGEITISVSAADYDSGMLYYTYSYNGGMTFSELQRWPDKTRDTFEFTLTVPSGMVPQIIVNAYNGYDLYTASNTLSLPSMNYETELAGEADEIAEETEDAVESASDSVLAGKADNARKTEKEKNPLTMGYFLQVCLFCALLVFAMAFSMTLILRSHKRRRRRRRK